MSVSNQEDAHSSLSREWLIARIVVIGGLIVALGAITYFGWAKPYIAERTRLIANQTRAQALSVAVADICEGGLSAAKNFGIVPVYGRVAAKTVYTTNVQGRYVCVGATPSTRYLVIVDLLCRRLKERRCLSLYSVRQMDGTVLYQRQS